LYIVSLVSISFNSQIHFILQFKKESRDTKNKARDARDEASEAKNKAKIEANARAIATTTIATTNRRRLLKSREQFVCTHVSFVLETTLILLSYLLLFDNLQECANNTLYAKS